MLGPALRRICGTGSLCWLAACSLAGLPVTMGQGADPRWFCKVQTLTDLQGSFSGGGDMEIKWSYDSQRPYRDCAWLVKPGLRMQEIRFTLAGGSRFSDQDSMAIYGIANAPAQRVATFSAYSELPKGSMSLVGSDAALFVLSASSNNTQFVLNYECSPYGTKIGDTWFSPVGYACVIGGIILASLLAVIMPIYMVCYFKAKRRQGQALRESELVARSEFAGRLEAKEAAERQVAASLNALPVEKFKNDESKPDDCSLCLEPYAEDDVLRILPCKHVFHQACIDTWFSSRRFMPRTCPLCKRNPLVHPAPESEESDQERSRPAESALELSSRSERSELGGVVAPEPDSTEEGTQRETASAGTQRETATAGAVVMTVLPVDSRPETAVIGRAAEEP
eukprot:TRINITY_DN29832_c0_g2_i1.p1 TRINITY_DN29832_c0_g2~~TRINITY_DN29832_c0_g2_i1.p1  ORF type:complete len:395 (+),score=49.35 TRINITY_DN29832_c0_g2_i1:39-1223(+)